jgi:hypothetical protein
MMEKHGIRTIGIVMVAALISLVPLVSAKAQTLPTATGGTVGRIAKFFTTTTLGNSLLFEGSGGIGLGTTTPLARWMSGEASTFGQRHPLSFSEIPRPAICAPTSIFERRP